MQLSIEVKIEEGLAMKVAEELGMTMEVMGDPEHPARQVTFAEVDIWLEGRMKDALVAEFSTAIKAISMREMLGKQAAEKVKLESRIDALVNKAVSLGGA